MRIDRAEMRILRRCMRLPHWQSDQRPARI